jgi:ABC-type Mn2+/Zn2+ transport system ATPase subunit
VVDSRASAEKPCPVHPAAALARALAATAGEAAIRRALPGYAGLFIAAGLLLGGNGLETATVVRGADESPLACLLLWSGWLLVATPALDAIWRTPASFWLRSLPVPRAWHLAVLLGFSLLAEAPWAALWWKGGGPVHGLAALLGALAIHAALLARPPGLPGLTVIALALAAPVITPPWLLSLGSCPIALVLLRRAWLAAPARGGHHPRSLVVGPAPLALALAHLAGLARGHLPVLLRATLITALMTAAAWLAARNNAVADPATLLVYAAGFLAPAALITGAALSAPLLAAESRAAWLLARTAPRVRLAAHLLAAAIPGLALALLHAAVLTATWRPAPAHALALVAALAVTGLALAVFAAAITRWAARFGARAPGRQLLALLLAAVLALALLAALGPAAPLAWLALAATAWLSGHVLSATLLDPPGVAPVLLTMTAVRKRLGARLVLDAVDLACPPGAVALVLGDNGAGKSTLLRIAAGILEPDAGAVTIAGATLTDIRPHHRPTPATDPSTLDLPPNSPAPHHRPAPATAPSALILPPSSPAPHHRPAPATVPDPLAARRALGYAPDTSDAFPDLSVRELLALVAALKRAAPPPDALRERLGLAAVWHQRLRTLSFGQVKRTWLLAALVGDPPLLILDEPSNGLDPAGAADLADLLRERAAAGHAALVATNDAAFAARLGGARHRLAAARLTGEP